LPIAALTEMVTASLNQSADAWKAGPAAAHVEARLIRWMNDAAGFGAGAFGALTSGGGVANAMALKMARDRALGKGTRRRGLAREAAGRLRVYASDQAHFSVARSLDLLGLGESALVIVPSDRRRRMDAAALARRLAADRRRGLRPMAIVATAGTTQTGSLDPIADIVAQARACGAHAHVDAAYGGALLFSRRFRHLLRGLEGADTVTVDPHKWLFQPFSLAVLLARDGRRLYGSFATEPDYLRKDLEAQPDRLDFYQYSLEGSRPFRGLKLYLTLHLLGREGLGALVDGTVDVARHLERRVESEAHFESSGAAVDLASVCFRYLPPWARGRSPAERRRPGARARLNRVQLSLQHAVERRGKAWFPTIVLDDTVFFRFGIFNAATTKRDIDATLQHLVQVAAARPARARRRSSF
jgi:aromatic-L-amino-acid decarboxylase